MANHSSATVREHTPHETQTRTNTIINALKRRAQAVLNDKSIDPQSRAIIRYALEINDPWLARLVRRVDADEPIVDTLEFEDSPETNDDDSSGEKIAALTEIICRAGDQPKTKSAALLVLMAIIESSAHPEVLADVAKHCAYIRWALHKKSFLNLRSEVSGFAARRLTIAFCARPPRGLVTPHSHPIDLHLLRKHSAAVGTADEISTNGNVEDNKERTLKLRRAVDAAGDVGFGILDPIDVPLDRTSGARNRERVEAGGQRSRRIEDAAERDVLPIRVSPMNGAEVAKRVLSLNLHDVHLSA